MRNMRMMCGFMVFAVLLLAIFGGCGSKNISKGMAPKWFLNPPESKDVIYGVGSSEKMASLQLATQVADANARTDIAATIQTSVQSMVRTFLQQSGTMDASRALQFSEAVGKNVIDVKLSGVRISKREPIDGRMFSLAEVSYDTMRDALLSAVRDAAAEMSEAKAKKAFEDLDKAIQGGQDIPIIRGQ